MTAERKAELHKRFIPGINAGLLIVCILGLISATSMLNRGYDAILENQRINRSHSDSLTHAVADGLQKHFNEKFHTVELRLQRIEDKR